MIYLMYLMDHLHINHFKITLYYNTMNFLEHALKTKNYFAVIMRLLTHQEHHK